MIKAVMDKIKLEKPMLAPAFVWDAYAAVEDVKSNQPKDELTALVSLIRHVCKIDKELKPFDKTVDENFKNWIFKQNAGQHNRFTTEQVKWLRMIKDHVASSYHIEREDFDLNPFNALGGIGKMYQLFESKTDDIINELNEVLAA
jgi:type I restriction enzyme R subunit